MKYIIQIVVVVMVVCGSGFGQEKINCPMDILVFDKSPKHNMLLTITSPEGKEVWNADSKTNKFLDSNSTSFKIFAYDWYSIQGNYSIKVEISDKYSKNKTNSSLEFAMNGNEIHVRTIIYLSYSEEHPKLADAFFYIEKRYNSSDSVILLQRLEPTPNGNPKYIIVNNSNVKIKGTAYDNHFFGDVLKYEDGNWKDYNRGICIDNVGLGDFFNPGDSATSDEGVFRDKIIFTPGRYKYCVYYTHSDYNFGLFSRRNQNNVVDVYLLEKEFWIGE